MKATVIKYEGAYAVCRYGDNEIGYIHSEDINDLQLRLKDKVAIGDELDVIKLGCDKYGDMYLSASRGFEERFEEIQKYEVYRTKVVRETKKGVICDINGIEGSLVGCNFKKGDFIEVSVFSKFKDKKFVLLNLESSLAF